MWNFSTGLNGSVTSTMTVPLNSHVWHRSVVVGAREQDRASVGIIDDVRHVGRPALQVGVSRTIDVLSLGALTDLRLDASRE
jgi:hypothetical protein